MNDIKKAFRLLRFSEEDSEANEMVLDMADDLSTKEIEPNAERFDQEGVSLTNDGKVKVPDGVIDILKKMASSDLMGIFAPEEYDGMGLSYALHCGVVERITRACASMGMYLPAQGLAIQTINDFGTEEAKDKYLPLLARGERLGAMAFSESNAGSDLGALRMKAEKEGDSYILNGGKIFISSAGIADTYIFLASSDLSKGSRGLSAFIVDGDSEGLSVARLEEKMGLHASPTGQLELTDVTVPKENLLGEESKGFSHILHELSSSRIGVAAQAVGISDAAFRKAVAYANQRVQFGAPLAKFQGIQFKIADMTVAIRTARNSYLEAAFLKDLGEDFSTESSIAKLYATEVSQKVTYEAVQIHGGYGYVQEYGVERHFRDARVTTLYEGTSEIQRVIISRAELARWRE